MTTRKDSKTKKTPVSIKAVTEPRVYYQSERVTLYHGDCLEVLPTLADGCVDGVVTSPPYNTLPAKHAPGGLHAERKSGVNKWIAKAATGYADQRDEAEYQAWLRAVMDECVRVSRGLVWMNHKVRFRDGVGLHPVRMFPYPIYSEVIWDRGGSMALNCKRYAPSHEVLLAFGSPSFWDDSRNTYMSVWRIAPQLSEEHPCPFPIEIAERPIGSSIPPDGAVLDPFTGSGTTAEAAIKLGRRFIGMEKEEKYCAIAKRRIQEAEQAFALFEPTPQEKQAEMFGEGVSP